MTSPCPLPLTPGDLSLWEKSLEIEQQSREKTRLAELTRCRQIIPEFFRHKKVKSGYLTGSLLKPHCFYDFSDIDIAVEGFQENFFQTMSQLEDLLDRNVHLIELENCPFAAAIRQTGEKIL